MNSMNEMFDYFDVDSVPTNAEVVEEFIALCEVEAEKLEVTVDYYLAEFVV